MNRVALLDSSVWARLRDDRIAGAAAENVYDRIEREELALTEPLVLEMRYSARDRTDFKLLTEELDAMPLLPLEPTAIRRALAAQAQLAELVDVSHPVKPIDCSSPRLRSITPPRSFTTTPTTSFSPSEPTSRSTASGRPNAAALAKRSRPALDRARVIDPPAQSPLHRARLRREAKHDSGRDPSRPGC